jgi:hypothetical protein
VKEEFVSVVLYTPPSGPVNRGQQEIRALEAAPSSQPPATPPSDAEENASKQRAPEPGEPPRRKRKRRWRTDTKLAITVLGFGTAAFAFATAVLTVLAPIVKAVFEVGSHYWLKQ